MSLLDQLSLAFQKGNVAETEKLLGEALAAEMPPREILDEGLIAGMAIVGEKFRRQEVFVPEMLIAARAMNKALAILEPAMIKADVKAKGVLLLGTVSGDLHDIGKNLVGIMFKGAGYKVIDLGVNVAADKFVEEAGKSNPDIIALSALLTTTMVNMRAIIEELKKAGCTSKILIGGAPITADFAREIGADGYADDAASAVGEAARVLGL